MLVSLHALDYRSPSLTSGISGLNPVVVVAVVAAVAALVVRAWLPRIGCWDRWCPALAMAMVCTNLWVITL